MNGKFGNFFSICECFSDIVVLFRDIDFICYVFRFGYDKNLVSDLVEKFICKFYIPRVFLRGSVAGYFPEIFLEYGF